MKSRITKLENGCIAVRCPQRPDAAIAAPPYAQSELDEFHLAFSEAFCEMRDELILMDWQPVAAEAWAERRAMRRASRHVRWLREHPEERLKTQALALAYAQSLVAQFGGTVVSQEIKGVGKVGQA